MLSLCSVLMSRDLSQVLSCRWNVEVKGGNERGNKNEIKKTLLVQESYLASFAIFLTG